MEPVPDDHYKLDDTVKLIVCDMAGTTVNEGGIVYRTLYNTIKSSGIAIEEDEMKDWYGINKTEVLAYFMNRDARYYGNQEMLATLLASFKQQLRTSYFSSNSITLIDPGLPALFNQIRATGVKIALNSGFSVDIQEKIIETLGMRDFIDGYISSESVATGRPAPYMIENLMTRFGVTDPGQVVKIGDSQNDILEGKNAKCGASIGVLTGAETREKLESAGADRILRSVMALVPRLHSAQ